MALYSYGPIHQTAGMDRNGHGDGYRDMRARVRGHVQRYVCRHRAAWPSSTRKCTDMRVDVLYTDVCGHNMCPHRIHAYACMRACVCLSVCVCVCVSIHILPRSPYPLVCLVEADAVAAPLWLNAPLPPPPAPTATRARTRTDGRADGRADERSDRQAGRQVQADPTHRHTPVPGPSPTGPHATARVAILHG